MKNSSPRNQTKRNDSSADPKSQNHLTKKSQSLFPKGNEQLRLGWYKTLRYSMRPRVMIIYLLGKWNYLYLDFPEFELLVELVKRTQIASEIRDDLVTLMFETVKFRPILSDYLKEADGTESEYRFTHHIFFDPGSRLRVPSKRLYKSLEPRCKKVLGCIYTAPRPTGVQNQKVNKQRKRGHTDKGSLSCNSAASMADREGGQILTEYDYAVGPFSYSLEKDNAEELRRLIPSQKVPRSPPKEKVEPTLQVVQRTEGPRSLLLKFILAVIGAFTTMFLGPLIILSLIAFGIYFFFRIVSK